MKHIALLLVIVGLSLAAAYGARNEDTLKRGSEVGKSVDMHAGHIAEAHEAYCVAQIETATGPYDGCTNGEEGSEPVADSPPNVTALPADVLAARAAWMNAVAAAEAINAEQSNLPAPAPAGERIGGWFGTGGTGFLIGLALLIVGVVLARIAFKAEAKSDRPGTDGAIDFGAMLRKLHSDVAALAAEMAAGASGEAGYESVRVRIEQLQVEAIEPLVEARTRVQARHGLAAFASIYEPLAAGERKLNRAWSALVDMHWPEAMASVQAADRALERAEKALTAVAPAG